MNHMIRKTLAGMAGATMLSAGAPALAQTAPGSDIDALIDSSATPAGAIALARSQADQGDLTAATATIERAMTSAAGQRDAGVRLYYVTLLCRLDDRERARIEMGNVDPRGARPADADEARAACGSLELRDAPDSSSWIIGSIGAGLAFDTNATAALAPQFALPGVTLPKDDGLSFVASAQVAGRAPIGSSAYFYGGLAGVTKDALSGPRLDYQIGEIRTGFGTETPTIGFEAGAVLRHGRIFGNPFYSEFGGQAEVSVGAGSHARVALCGEVDHQDYMNSVVFFDRDGTRYDAALEYRAQPDRETSFVAGAAWEDKTAQTRVLGYQGFRLYAAARLPISQSGTYTALSATVRHVDYRDAAFVVDRKETRWFARAALGTPLLRDIDVEGAVSYSRRDYNAASGLSDYDSFGAELRLVWKFGK
jgi:hypothetical protein